MRQPDTHDGDQELLRIKLSGNLDHAAIRREIVGPLENLGSKAGSQALVFLDCSVFDNQPLEEFSPVAQLIVQCTTEASESMPVFSFLDRMPILAVITKMQTLVFQLRNAQIAAKRPFELLCAPNEERAREMETEYFALYQQLSAGKEVLRLQFAQGPPPILVLLQAFLNLTFIGRLIIKSGRHLRNGFYIRAWAKNDPTFRSDATNPMMLKDLEREIFNKLVEIYGPLDYAA